MSTPEDVGAPRTEQVRSLARGLAVIRSFDAQRPQQTLADVAARFTTRLNLGVASIYITQLGGQELAPGLRLPRVKAMTLAVAGRFVMLRTERDNGSLE